MSVAPTQCHLLALTSRKSDIEYRLLQITAQVSQMAAKTASLQEELMLEVRSKNIYQTVLTDENSRDLEEELEAFYSGEWFRAGLAQIDRHEASALGQ